VTTLEIERFPAPDTSRAARAKKRFPKLGSGTGKVSDATALRPFCRSSGAGDPTAVPAIA
jgi:hypothetical protein